MRVEIISNFDQFLKLREEWNALLLKSKSDHIHLTHEWLSCWWENFDAGKTFCVILVYNENALIGAVPLMIQEVGKLFGNRMKFRQLNFLASGLTDSADFIITQNREIVFNLIIKKIIELENTWDEIFLKQIRSDSPNIDLFKNISIDSKYKSTFNIHSGCPIINLTGDFESYYKGIGKTWRKKNERHIRKLNNDGKLTFEAKECFEQSDLNSIIELNEKRYSLVKDNSEFRNRFSDKHLVNFLSNVFPHLSKSNLLQLFLLRHNEKLITYSITYKFNNILYRWNTSYDHEYYKFSVGRIITKYIIQYCFENNFASLDWMAGAYDNKMQWTDEKVDLNIFTLNKINLKTSISEFYNTLKTQFKKLPNV